MAQTTILAAGTTAATSTDIVVAAGASVTVGLFVDTGPFPVDAKAVLYIDSPGLDVREEDMDNANRVTVIGGPCTARLTREACGTAFGAFTET